MGFDLAHLEKYSNLIVVADIWAARDPQRAAPTPTAPSRCWTLRGEAPEEGTVTPRGRGGYTSQEVTCVEPSHAFCENDTYLLFLNQTAFSKRRDLGRGSTT